jgi:hypothetical protein
MEPNIPLTRHLVTACFHNGYEEVVIEDKGQHIYAWPPLRGPVQWDSWPILWKIVSQFIPDRMGCGNGGSVDNPYTRGDHSQNCSKTTFLYPGVYLKAFGFPSQDELEAAFVRWKENKAVWGMERALGRKDAPNENFPIVCPHGTRENCSDGCFLSWGLLDGRVERKIKLPKTKGKR